MKELENQGDDLTREIIELLNTQYITPFDREDIYGLAKAIDDVVDYIENASDLLGLYKVDSLDASSPPSSAACLVSAGEHLAKALSELCHLRRRANRTSSGSRPSRTRATGSSETRIAGSSRRHARSGRSIRWKDIFEALEGAIDACETAADLVGNIVVKNV